MLREKLPCFCPFRILEKVKMCEVEVGCVAEAAKAHVTVDRD